MAPQRRAPGDPPPVYGPMEERFSVEINHAGLFCGSGMNKAYFDGRVDHFDGCEVETWSPLWIYHFVGQLGHDPARVELYWLLPGKHLHDGLRIIQSDADTLMMSVVVPKFQYFQLYVDQKYLLDDIYVIGSPTLPMVLSPRTEINVSIFCDDAASPNSRRRCKVKAVKGNLQNCFSPNTKGSGDKDKDDSDDSDSNYGDNLVDSDNEFDKDDDDLFAEWVDENYEDVKGKKKAENFDSDYDTNELDLPASDSDYEPEVVDEESKEEDAEDNSKKKKKRVKLRAFRPEEMQAPNFTLGMPFSSVVELRRAIQNYIIQERVEIKYGKNDLQRVRAHCVDGCPWYLFAAPNSRTKKFVVKTYVGTHTCSKEWDIKQFTAKFLAAYYIETFRADDKMTLSNFGRLVRKD
uniref:Transposase MuDR plant domain-containing protein n=1 Tax=Triticum urartu TaxID=4572 RepID=A0A8R7QA95_TRIUA